MLANAGNANACTGAKGAENALRMAKAAAKLFLLQTDVIVCSTGVIGQQINVEVIEKQWLP